MATISVNTTTYVGWTIGDKQFGHSVDFFWEAMGDDDTGSFVPTSGLADKTLTISGSIGAGTVTLQGSNDGTTWFTLNSAVDGTAISVSSTGVFVILENPLYIRPVTASGSSNDVDVHVLARLTI